MDEACGSLLWKLISVKQVVKGGIHGQSATSMILCFYPILEGMRIEQNLAHGIYISWYDGERLRSEHPQMGTLRRLLGRSGGRGGAGGETVADQRSAGGIRSGGDQLFPCHGPVQRAVRGSCGQYRSTTASRRRARQRQGTARFVWPGVHLPRPQEV